MKTIKLTDEQREAIMRELYYIPNGEFRFEKDFDIGDGKTLSVECKGYVYSYGYIEDDYDNGTGAQIETSRNGDISMSILILSDDEDPQECLAHDDDIKIFYEHLNTIY